MVEHSENALPIEDRTCTIEEVGAPTNRDELSDLRDNVQQIAERVRSGRAIGEWRLKHLDRVAEILYRAEIFGLAGRGFTYKAGEEL